MNTDLHDDDLRRLLSEADPAELTDSDEAVDRVLQRLDLSTEPRAQRPRRRWWDLALAACAGAALVAGTVVVSQTTTGGNDVGVAYEGSAPAMTEVAPSEQGAADGADSVTSSPQALARDASAVVATDDLPGARELFITTVTDVGGRVTSESSTTQGSNSVTSADIYPPSPSVPGVSVTAEVPTQAYDRVVASLRELGEIIQFTQSTVDVGAEVADTKARVAALRSSVTTLRGLLDEAQSVSDVVNLENAIAQRQSELDGLLAQQRFLESQVAVARISVQLLQPDDAAELFGSPSRWDDFSEAISTLWMGLGRALLWTSPLWIIGALWWLRQRRR